MNIECVKTQANKLKEKHDVMTDDVKLKKEKLSEYIIYIEEYYITIEEITIWVTHAKKNKALVDPISTDTKTLKRQLKLLEVSVTANRSVTSIECFVSVQVSSYAN